MKCESFELELAALSVVDDRSELPPDLAQHAIGCAACEARVEERIELDRLLDRMPEFQPAADFIGQVRARLAAPAPRRLIRIPGRYAAALAVAASLALALRFTVFAPASDRPREVEARPDPEMLVQLDLQLDWEILDEHAEDLDLLAANDLLAAAEEFGGEG